MEHFSHQFLRPSTPRPQANKRRARLRRGGEHVCLTNSAQTRYIAPTYHHVEIPGKEGLVFMPGLLPVVMLVFDVGLGMGNRPRKTAEEDSMRKTVAFAIVALVSAILMVPAMVWTQDEVVQQFNNGSINWSSGKVTAVGIGAPPAQPANMAQARAMARRAAITVARRNLLEITQGVQVDSMTLVKDFVVKSDIVRTSVQGVVRNAQVVDTAYMSDGSVEVTIMMDMGGEFASVVLPPPPVMPGPMPPTGAEAPAQVFTGLVIDARGLGTRPAMAPKILDENGKEIYGSAMVDREYAVQQGMVGYAKDLSAAQANSRVTDKPITVKALKTSGPAKCDLVISSGDAAKLAAAAENLSFLQKCRVMLVLD